MTRCSNLALDTTLVAQYATMNEMYREILQLQMQKTFVCPVSIHCRVVLTTKSTIVIISQFSRTSMEPQLKQCYKQNIYRLTGALEQLKL